MEALLLFKRKKERMAVSYFELKNPFEARKSLRFFYSRDAKLEITLKSFHLIYYNIFEEDEEGLE